MQFQHQVGVVTGLLGGETLCHHRIGGNDGLADGNRLVPFAQGHIDLHQQDARTPFVAAAAILLLGNPLVGKLQILFQLLQDAPSVVSVEIQGRFLDFFSDPGDVAELVDQVEIAVGPVEIALSDDGVPFRLILVSAAIHAVQDNVGVFDPVPLLGPVPADLALAVGVEVGGSEIVVEVGETVRLVRARVDTHVAGHHFRGDGSMVTEKLVAHVLLAGGNRGIQSVRVDIGILRRIERERFRRQPALVTGGKRQAQETENQYILFHDGYRLEGKVEAEIEGAHREIPTFYISIGPRSENEGITDGERNPSLLDIDGCQDRLRKSV